MNGSYKVPTGNNRSPLIACERPSAESAQNRFISAMPSSMCWPFEARPFLTGPYIHRLSKRLHLCRRHQAGVVILVPGERQAIAFDRVGDEANRPVVIDRVESGNDRAQIMAAEIVHQPRQL